MNSKISHTAGGIERTTLNLFNFLNKQKGINAYAIFNSFPADIPFKDNLIKGEIKESLKLKEIIQEKNIDILLFPAGPWYTLIGHKAREGTNCKIITAYHSKYDSKDIIFRTKLLSNLRYKKNMKLKVRSLIKLLFYSKYSNQNYKYYLLHHDKHLQ